MFDTLPTTQNALLAELGSLAHWVGFQAYLDTAILARQDQIARALALLNDPLADIAVPVSTWGGRGYPSEIAKRRKTHGGLA